MKMKKKKNTELPVQVNNAHSSYTLHVLHTDQHKDHSPKAMLETRSPDFPKFLLIQKRNLDRVIDFITI